jgi:hypothetical protein
LNQAQRETIYKKIIEIKGRDYQLTKASEELAELTKELCKYLVEERTPERIAAIAEETADVRNMCDQIEMMFNIGEQIELWREEKLNRLVKTYHIDIDNT